MNKFVAWVNRIEPTVDALGVIVVPVLLSGILISFIAVMLASAKYIWSNN